MTESKDLLEICDLSEMANAYKKDTGLNGVLYFSTKDEVSNKQAHALGRVKLRGSNGSEYSCSILTKKDGKYKIVGTNDAQMSKLIKFVKSNKDLLWRYWNTPIDDVVDGILTGDDVKSNLNKV